MSESPQPPTWSAGVATRSPASSIHFLALLKARELARLSKLEEQAYERAMRDKT